MPISVSAARSRRELADFINLPWSIYDRDPYWAPLPKGELCRRFDRARNPFFEHGRAEFFIARRGREVVGRITAIQNPLQQQTHHDMVGFFGFFECVNDIEAAAALVEQAGNWLARQGLSVMRGPMNYSINDECGLLIEGFEQPAVLWTAYNPSYYADLLTACGFVKAKDLLAYEALKETMFPARARTLMETARRRWNVQVRCFDKRHMQRDCAILCDIFASAWADNWGFLPLTDGEVREMARTLSRIGDPDLVRIAEIDGRPAGFIIVLPDWNQAMLGARRWPWPVQLLKILWDYRKIDTARVMAFGVRAEYRWQGIDILLCHEAYQAGMAKGYRRVEMSWVLEDNLILNAALPKLGARAYKRYRIYDLPLASTRGASSGIYL